MDDIASPIVNHCRTLSFKKQGVNTFVFNDNSDND